MAEYILTTAKVVKAERMKSSANGNPRFWVTFDDGVEAPTAVDAMLGYAITNQEYRDGDHDVIINRRGERASIIGMRYRPAVGDRVQLRPHTDYWMSGDRFGEVTDAGELSSLVRLDRSGRSRRFRHTDLLPA